MFPSADVSTMFYKLPALLCEAQWPGVLVSPPPLLCSGRVCR